MIATIVFAALAAVGLVVTLILLALTIGHDGTEEFGWYFAFSLVASIINVIPAVVALILGIVGRSAKSGVPLIGIVVGGVAIVVLVAQFIYLAAV